jgi:hypothetical protein
MTYNLGREVAPSHDAHFNHMAFGIFLKFTEEILHHATLS